MARRKLMNLSNLRKYAIATTAKTVKEKECKQQMKRSKENLPSASPKAKHRVEQLKSRVKMRVNAVHEDTRDNDTEKRDTSQTHKIAQDTDTTYSRNVSIPNEPLGKTADFDNLFAHDLPPPQSVEDSDGSDKDDKDYEAEFMRTRPY
ncbi:hypothetical protein K435DRAFT_799986 [Dendrothele bispora CBS 962.96]|uniref:Uncharacterized protein n=1 Tax=Dendrothele bispora (strain CBS 962.96) TaxID=1314807 RepID=A0A4S8LVJ6_DENBC|nr:hypothetical protein K435DRAFT_799986 [Dendrothele bispora CBS 962.96]